MTDVDREQGFNFGVVSDDLLYRSAQPSEEFLMYLKETYKIKTIVSLTMDIPGFERKFCEENGINLVVLPIKSWRRWLEPDEVQDFLKLLRLKYGWNVPVLVHCIGGKDGGKNRTSTLVALYRIGLCGWSLKAAVAEMKQWKANLFWRLFIQTRASKVIEGFEERRLALLYLMRVLNFAFVMDGLIYIIRHEKNLQIFLGFEILLMLVPSLLGRFTLLEFIVVLGFFIVFDVVEILNTTSESSVDIAQPNFDVRVKRIKDMPPGALAILGIFCLFAWAALVFFH